MRQYSVVRSFIGRFSVPFFTRFTPTAAAFRIRPSPFRGRLWTNFFFETQILTRYNLPFCFWRRPPAKDVMMPLWKVLFASVFSLPPSLSVSPPSFQRHRDFLGKSNSLTIPARFGKADLAFRLKVPCFFLLSRRLTPPPLVKPSAGARFPHAAAHQSRTSNPLIILLAAR